MLDMIAHVRICHDCMREARLSRPKTKAIAYKLQVSIALGKRGGGEEIEGGAKVWRQGVDMER